MISGQMVRGGLVALCAAACAGCAGTGYMGHRGRDAMDILTCTVGVGTGAKVRVGPVQVAAIENSDLAGLRDGEWFANGNDLVENRETYAPFPLPHTVNWSEPVRKETFGTKKSDPQLIDLRERAQPHEWVGLFGQETFSTESLVSASRHAGIRAYSPFPLLAFGNRAAYFSQIELTAGLGLSLRLGFNPGECADFLLGWFGLDLYGDDAQSAAPPAPKNR